MTDSPLPAGTVTFVFTDIEGSTRLLERVGDDRYADVLAQHHRLLRDAFVAHGGVVFGTEGDAMFVAFERAGAAAAAAVDAQRALATAPWPDGEVVRVRVGIHTGDAAVVEGDYVGMSVHVAARVAAAAHGGQVLMSGTTRALVPDVGVVDLGSHRLKDVGDVTLWQLTHPELQAEFPALRTLTAMPNNLPASVDSFVGRDVELAELVAALGEHRLVTLTGAGGSGKTRLALEAAASLLPGTRDGVWFVGLAVADDPDRVIPLTAAAVRVAERSDELLADSLERWLREREVVIVLDNCEHLIAGASAFADRYLRACPDLRILATSREVLGVRGERAISTPPLSVSDDPELTGVSDAVELFLVRAMAAAPRFEPDRANRVTVTEICRRLDGLPLAIELAAARLRALSLEQLAARLDDRFRLLSGGTRADLPRQRTLEAVVAWSYDLLTDEERLVFQRLAVFPGSFTLDAAELVVSGDGIDEADVIEVLMRLVEKSLVVTVAHGDSYRYQLLETLRQYAHDRLVDAGHAEALRDRLLAWAMTRVDYVEASLRRPAQDAAIRSVTDDAEALRAAMQWAIEKGELLVALRIVAAVPLGLNGERRDLITDLLGRVGEAADGWVAARANSALGNMAFEQGDWAVSSRANHAAAQHFLAAGSPWNAAWALYLDAHSNWGMGELARVDDLIAQAVQQFREADDRMGLGYALWVAALRSSDPAEARAMAAEADTFLREVDATMGIAHNVEGRGILAYEAGELTEAARFVDEAVLLFSDYGNLGCSAHALEAAAIVVGAAGQAEAATELLGAAENLRELSGHGHRPWEIRARHGDIEQLIPALPAATSSVVMAAGRRHTLASAAHAARDALDRVRRDATTVQA